MQANDSSTCTPTLHLNTETDMIATEEAVKMEDN